MRLTLATVKKGTHKDNNGIDKIGVKDLIVIDSKTGEKVEGHSGFLWGDKDLLTKPNTEPLLPTEHFEGHPDDANYIVLVIRCDGAVDLT